MKTKAFVLVGLAFALIGCNMGMAPSGGDSAQVEANFKNQSPKDQIQQIKLSPASPEKKAQLIKDIENRTGYHDPSDTAPSVGGGSQSNPSSGTAPTSGQ